MISHKSRQALFAAIAAAMLLTSGTAGVALAATASANGVQDDETPDGDEVLGEFRDRIESLETVQFTRTEEMTYNNETNTRTVQVHADLTDEQKRVETLTTTMGSNTTTVWNGSSVETYYADENRVSEYEVTGTTLLPRIEGLANESMVSYEYLGTETIDGQETYVLDAVPELGTQGDEDTEAEMTVYIDTETYFPVQVESHVESDEYEHSSTVHYDEVSLNEEISDSTFDLDLPDDVEEDRGNSLPDISSHDTYDSLVSDTDLSVPAVNLTDGFSFESGFTIDDEDFHSVSLTYTDGEESVSIIIRSEPITGLDYGDSDRFDAVEVGDTTGYLYTSEDYVSLYVEGDQPYTIHGELDEETSIDIADAVLDG